MDKKTAIVIGATGLIGSYLVNYLSKDARYQTIKIFSRRETGFQSEKVEEFVVDFKSPETWRHLITGDEIFSCLGTTIKKAGSEAAFRFVDYELPGIFAEAGSENQVGKYFIVTAMGASVDSMFFYSRVKGEIEREIQKYPFQQTGILRPSLLLGERDEQRLGEDIGKIFMKLVDPLMVGPLKSARAIAGETVAKAMIQIANSPQDQTIFASDQIQELGDAYLPTN